MANCEKCWGDAYLSSKATGKSQAECYRDLIKERKDDPCSQREKAGQFWDATKQKDKRTLKNNHKQEALNMNEKIREHVKKYNNAKGWGTTDESIIETIIEGKIVWTGNESSRRHWRDCFRVVEVDGMLIGFDDAITTGDDSPVDKGWEFDSSSICEVQSKEVITTIYQPIV